MPNLGLRSASGIGVFSYDLACDIRDPCRQLLEDGTEDGPATRLTLEKFTPDLEESDSIALIAFAVPQSKLGRLEPDVRDRATLAIIDVGADLGATGSGVQLTIQLTSANREDSQQAITLVECYNVPIG